MNYYAKQALAKVKGKLRAKKYQMRKKMDPKHQLIMETLSSILNLQKYWHNPELTILDFDKEFILHCDASEEGLGVVLHQE